MLVGIAVTDSYSQCKASLYAQRTPHFLDKYCHKQRTITVTITAVPANTSAAVCWKITSGILAPI